MNIGILWGHAVALEDQFCLFFLLWRARISVDVGASDSHV